jgi:hypothetical protein
MMTCHPGLIRRATLATALALLAGCGGGVWIGIGDDDWGDRPPSVSIAAAATSVPAGGTLRVIAAAAGENGIDSVALYRRDAGGWTWLGNDRLEPYEWLVPVPADGRGELEVFARATDRAGLQADSGVLRVLVLP